MVPDVGPNALYKLKVKLDSHRFALYNKRDMPV